MESADYIGRSEAASVEEKLRHPRTNALSGARVSWAGDGAGVVSLLSNLSLSGMFIQTPEPAPVGETLALKFESPGNAIQARGIVRRSDQGRGMGIEFVEMSEDDRRRVVSLLQSALKQQFSQRLQAAPPEPAPPLRPHMAPSKQRPSERRTRVRLSISAAAEVRNVASGERFCAAIGDIGREGCYIRTDRTVTVGTDLVVQITKGQFAFCADARVVHAFAGKGFGAMFTAVEPNNVATLEAWLDSSQRRLGCSIIAGKISG